MEIACPCLLNYAKFKSINYSGALSHEEEPWKSWKIQLSGGRHWLWIQMFSHPPKKLDIKINAPTEWDPENHFLFCLWNMSRNFLLLLFKNMWNTFWSVTWSCKYTWDLLLSRELAFPVQRRLHPSSEFFLTISPCQVEWERNKDLHHQII